MRHSGFFARQLCAAGLLAVIAMHAAVAAPWLDASSACTEWIAMGEPMRALIYRSDPLAARNDRITRAIVIVHGGSRDANVNFTHVLAAAFLAGALEDTVIVSPRFASNEENVALDGGGNSVAAARSAARDSLAPNELNWISVFGGRHWNAGGVAVNAKVTSYEVIDEILRRLAVKGVFPNLKSIVVAGHSSGGQFVGRYQMVNRVHEGLGVKVTYLVSNPGAYTYLDNLRPTASAIPSNVSSAVSGFIPLGTTKPAPPFVPYADARNCTTYDAWPYGLNGRVGYSAAATGEQLKQQIISRPTTFLLGELDILPLVNFDISCAAMAQGSSRLARGLAFGRYVRENYAAQHKTVVVEGCGHNTRCMLTADAALPLLFPRD
ncbi:MAG TPA: hypothetical protein VGO84_06015 [Burkholderiales bacterium]|nr:hypothetical protein [Burkholderiales bacterium]